MNIIASLIGYFIAGIVLGVAAIIIDNILRKVIIKLIREELDKW